MSDTLTKEIESVLADESYWYWFLLKTIQLDKTNNKPNGWHWFWGIDYLHQKQNKFPKLDIAKIQNTVPDKHWLKKVSTSSLPPVQEDLRNLVTELSLYLKTKNYSNVYFTIFSSQKNNVFSNFIFPVETVFGEKYLHYDINFSNTIFIENVYFTKTIFLNTANFENAEFHGKTANFRDATFKKEANFEKVTFKNYANFKGATFGGRTIFQQAKFKLHAPRFYGATFNNELILNRIELPESKKFTHGTVNGNYQKTIEASKDTYEDYQKTIEENKSAYETLIYLMEKQNKYHDKHRFFREEMRWRQFGNKLTKERRLAYLHERRDEYSVLLQIEHNSEIAFFYLYDKISDYGYGIGRTFSWWLGHIFIGAIVIFIIASCTGLGTQQALFCSASTSFANANPFVFIGFKEGGLTDCYKVLHYLLPIKFGAIRGVQTFFGIPLLFLLLTTLRVRFRLGGTTSNTTINATITPTPKKR